MFEYTLRVIRPLIVVFFEELKSRTPNLCGRIGRSGQSGQVCKVVEIDCEKSMKLETSPKVTKSKRSLHWCRSISKKISVQVLLQYQSKSYYIIGQDVYYGIGRFYYIIRHLLHYRAFFITLSGTYYSIGRSLHYWLVHPPLIVKLKFRKYAHQLHMLYHCITLQYNHNIWQGSYAEAKL